MSSGSENAFNSSLCDPGFDPALSESIRRNRELHAQIEESVGKHIAGLRRAGVDITEADSEEVQDMIRALKDKVAALINKRAPSKSS